MKDQERLVDGSIARWRYPVERPLWNAPILRDRTYATVLTLDCDCDQVDRRIDELAAVVFLEFDVAYCQAASSKLDFGGSLTVRAVLRGAVRGKQRSTRVIR
jgi:hypothetical protein